MSVNNEWTFAALNQHFVQNRVWKQEDQHWKPNLNVIIMSHRSHLAKQPFGAWGANLWGTKQFCTKEADPWPSVKGNLYKRQKRYITCALKCSGLCVFPHSYQHGVKQQQMLSPWLALVELVPSLRSVVVFILESMVGNKSNWQAWWKSLGEFSRAHRWAVIFIPDFHPIMGNSEIWTRLNRQINILLFIRPTKNKFCLFTWLLLK